MPKSRHKSWGKHFPEHRKPGCVATYCGNCALGPCYVEGLLPDADKADTCIHGHGPDCQECRLMFDDGDED